MSNRSISRQVLLLRLTLLSLALLTAAGCSGGDKKVKESDTQKQQGVDPSPKDGEKKEGDAQDGDHDTQVGGGGPGTDAPGTSGPGTSGPGTGGPGTSGPGTSGPGTSGPGAKQPKRPKIASGEPCQAGDQCMEEGEVCAHLDIGGDDRANICRQRRLDSGALCSADRDCEDGYCVEFKKKVGGGIEGVCTGHCSVAADCASYHSKNGLESICVKLLKEREDDIDGYCAASCRVKGDCPTGFTCVKQGDGSEEIGFCRLSKAGGTEQIEFPNEICVKPDTTKPLLTLGRTLYPASVVFNLPEDVIGYHIMGRSAGGDSIIPRYITVDDTRKMDLLADANSHMVYASLVSPGNLLNSLKVPIGPLPRYRNLLGRKVKLEAFGSPYDVFCYSIATKRRAGNVLHLNVYLVGVEGLDENNAERHVGLQRAFSKLREIYAKKQYYLGDIRYKNVPPEVAKKYRVLDLSRDAQPVRELVKHSVAPPDPNRQMSLNIFIVNTMVSPSGTIGYSSGLPGLPGVHGSSYSGVVFTGEFLNSVYREVEGKRRTYHGGDYTGVIMAHEIGHFVGLFHTSEESGAAFDPLPDTPECLPNVPCAHGNNLMLPTADIEHVNLTDQQAAVFGESPLFVPQ